MKAISILATLAALCTSSAPHVWSADSPHAPAASEGSGQVDLNTATISVLEAIPEIGTNFANAVVAARPFKSVYELQRLLKISDAAMIALHAKVTASPPRIPSPLAAPSSAATPAREPSPSAALAADQERTEARRRHIRRDGPKISEPLPPARAETKLESPGKNYVWKPGHWAPVQGEWKWTPGEWAIPPTSISVWIDGNYDPKTQRWSPGYWEPDKIQLSDSEGGDKR